MQRTQFYDYLDFIKQLSFDWYGYVNRKITNKPLLLKVGDSEYRVSLVQNKAVVKRVNMPNTYYDSFVEFFTHRLQECSIYSRSVRIAHLINKGIEQNLEKSAWHRIILFLLGPYETFKDALRVLEKRKSDATHSDDTIEKAFEKMTTQNPEIFQFKTEIEEITQKILNLKQDSPNKHQLDSKLIENTEQLKSQFASLQSSEQHQSSSTSIQDQLDTLKKLCSTLMDRAEILKDTLSHRLSIPDGSSELLQVLLDPDFCKV